MDRLVSRMLDLLTGHFSGVPVWLWLLIIFAFLAYGLRPGSVSRK